MSYHRNPTPDVPVYDGACPSASPGILSLLSTIGEAKRWVVRLSFVGQPGYSEFWPGDNTTVIMSSGQQHRGCGGGYAVSPHSRTAEVFTDENAAVHWQCSNANPGKVYLEGWHDATAHDPAVLDPPDAASISLPGRTHAAPSPFQIVDFWSILGSGEKLLILEYDYVSGSANSYSFYTRSVGGALRPHLYYSYPHGPSCAQLRYVQPVQVATNSDEFGRIEHANYYFDSFVNIWVHGWLDDWEPASGVLKSGAPPLAFGDDDIDLSAQMPAGGVARLYVARATGVYNTIIEIAFRQKGSIRDTSSFYGVGNQPSACELIFLDGQENAYVDVGVGPTGLIEWQANVDTYDVDVWLIGFDSASNPPVFTNKLPTGVTEKPYIDISFSVEDDSQVDSTTLDLDLVGPSSTFHAIVDGVFQEGFGGTITPNANNGFDVICSIHPLLEEGAWTANVEADDDVGATGNDSWGFTTEWIPELIQARATQRRIVEIQWDLPVRVRDTAIQPQDGVDRYTPVDWIGIGGQSDDSANPANFSIVRPSSGNLSQDGEAVDLLPVRADETESAWYDESAIRYSDKLDVKVDFQQTARADYRITIGVLASPHQDSIGGDLDFFGFTPSKVQRGSLNLWDMFSKGHRRDDRDGTGDLLRFFTALQEVLDRMIEDVDAFFLELCDIDHMRSEFLDTLLFDLGDPLGYLFDLTSLQKRKLARTLVEIYREKGTCKGIINAVRLFVGVTLTGCQGGWYAGDTWELAEGTYPNEIGGNELGINTYLGGSGYDLNSFWVTSPIALTQGQRDQISAIANYMKPAGAHFLGIIEP